MNPEVPSEAGSGPTFTETRELKRPYFILRARGGEKTFYSPELQSVIRDPKAPFAAYLPAAEVDNPQKPGKVTFVLPEGIDRNTLTPMAAFPESTIRAFQSAAEAFLQGEGLDPFRRETRNSFLLPDPEEEPDAWWVYGPPEDRRLLILWGCEFQRGTSLPLLPDPRKPASPSILDRLKARIMDWSDYQRQMRDLLLSGKEPFARFIGRPEQGRKGEWKSILHQGKRLEWEKTKPLKTLGSGEIAAFQKAAGDFYNRAYHDSSGASDFEKELRTRFRLPDIDKHPELFRIAGGKLLVAVPDDLEPADTLCPREDDELNLPAAVAGEGGAEVIPETVLDKLQARATPWMARAIAGAVVLVLLIAAGVLFELFADRTPPAVANVVSENTPERAIVRFDEEVHPDHLEFAEVVSEEEAARGKANTPAFQIVFESGDRIEIFGINHLNGSGPEVELVTAFMEEGNYLLTVQGIRDTSRKKNRIDAPTEYPFQVVDTIPPTLEQVSADTSDSKAVLLFFDEPLDRSSATLRSNFEIRGQSIIRAQLLEDNRSVRLVASADFQKDQPYTLEVLNLQDASLSRNPIPEPITFTFTYRDTIPPRLESVQAPQSQVKVFATFSEKVTPASAQTPANYAITVDGQLGPAVKSSLLYDDGVTVALTTEPLFNGVSYGFFAENIADQGGGGTLAMEQPVLFSFTGAEDTEPPFIEKVTVRFQQNFWVTFNEPVEIEPLLDGARWSFSDPALQIEGDPQPSDSEGTRIKFKTTSRATDQLYTLRYDGEVQDLIGNSVDGLTSPQFQGVNISIIPTNTLRIQQATPAENNRVLVLQFNEGVVKSALETEANYLLDQGVQVLQATADPTDPAKVFLSLDKPLNPGTRYELTLREMRTRRAPNVSIPSLSHRFTP